MHYDLVPPWCLFYHKVHAFPSKFHKQAPFWLANTEGNFNCLWEENSSSTKDVSIHRFTIGYNLHEHFQLRLLEPPQCKFLVKLSRWTPYISLLGLCCQHPPRKWKGLITNLRASLQTLSAKSEPLSTHFDKTAGPLENEERAVVKLRMSRELKGTFYRTEEKKEENLDTLGLSARQCRLVHFGISIAHLTHALIGQLASTSFFGAIPYT